MEVEPRSISTQHHRAYRLLVSGIVIMLLLVIVIDWEFSDRDHDHDYEHDLIRMV